MCIHEIVLPETKPETEWVRGRALQKVSPTYPHAILQGRLFAAFDAWASAGGRGRVGTEWRFRIAPPRAVVRPLVPDVAYLSFDALAADAPDDEVHVPLGAPTVAIEILSPDDRARDVRSKVDTYLAAGSAAVIIVDPRLRTMTVHDPTDVRVLRAGDVLAHSALPEFALDVGAFFARALG
ncbi:MAG TPA: Uma2 family endonuclease [Candidatus Elarobacter sp.]|jgi:Uma2 family endonuclease|nr:Uma2 family endonuclease [Candidatus Elarobacter sp.]